MGEEGGARILGGERGADLRRGEGGAWLPVYRPDTQTNYLLACPSNGQLEKTGPGSLTKDFAHMNMPSRCTACFGGGLGTLFVQAHYVRART